MVLERRSEGGKKRLFLSLLIFSLILLSGCAANPTRTVPATPHNAEQVSLPSLLKARHIGLHLFDYKDTEIKGGHHEGLLQVRQPWNFGLSAEEKAVLYDNAGEVAALAFAAELKKQGMNVTVLSHLDDSGALPFDLLLTGKVAQIVLNTYGRGTREGLGSAGNYWEATLLYSDIQLRNLRAGRIVWDGNIERYAKLENSPATLDWTNLTLAVNSLRGAMLLSQMQMSSSLLTGASKGKDYIENFEAEYSISDYTVSPIEVAARHAAVLFLQQIGTGD